MVSTMQENRTTEPRALQFSLNSGSDGSPFAALTLLLRKVNERLDGDRPPAMAETQTRVLGFRKRRFKLCF